MKKIVATTVAASLVAGAAFADVKISSNFRIRPVLAKWTIGTEADTSARYFDLDSVQGASDTITFEAKNDYAGVKLAFNDNLTKSTVGFDSYNGFLKFGNLTFTGGYYDNRFANRVTKNQNNLSLLEQNWAATYNTAKEGYDKDNKSTYYTAKTTNKFTGNKKLGINANVSAFAGVDSDNITAVNGTKSLSFVTDYLIPDVAGGKLQLTAVLNKNDDNWITWNDAINTKKNLAGDDVEASNVEVDSSYAFRVSYTNDALAADANLHLWYKTLVASAFVSPKMVKGLDATLGFTYAQTKDNSVVKYKSGNYVLDPDTGTIGQTEVDTAKSYDADGKYWALDARGRYQITDALAATLMINYTNIYEERNEKEAKDAGVNGGVLDNVLNVTYTVNDLATVFGEIEYVLDNRSYADKKDVGDQLAAQIGALFTAGKGAEIDVAARCTLAGIGNDFDKDTLGTQIQLPVCMRVKL